MGTKFWLISKLPSHFPENFLPSNCQSTTLLAFILTALVVSGFVVFWFLTTCSRHFRRAHALSFLNVVNSSPRYLSNCLRRFPASLDPHRKWELSPAASAEVEGPKDQAWPKIIPFSLLSSLRNSSFTTSTTTKTRVPSVPAAPLAAAFSTLGSTDRAGTSPGDLGQQQVIMADID